MLAICLLLAAGPIHFVDQPLAGVSIGPPTPFSGQPTTNYLQSDLDDSGQVELVLPDAIWFQENGTFPESSRVPWPVTGPMTEGDVFEAGLYIRTPHDLRLFHRSDGQWRETLHQPLEWPGTRLPGPSIDGQHQSVALRRFTYDIDGDRTPELLDLDGQGVHVFRQVRGRYVAAGVLGVLPTMTLKPSTTQTIWPAERRHIVLPEQGMACRLLVRHRALALITHTNADDGTLAFHRELIQLAQDADGRFVPGERTLSQFDSLPPHVRPCHLNDDETLDFAGTRWLVSESSPLPMPIQETWVSLDGGASFHIERAPAIQHFRPLCNFADVDSDGDLDLITESTRLFAGGTQEAIKRYVSERTLPHRIEIRAQSATHYNPDPVTIDLDIDLGAPPVSGGPMLERYQRGALLNLTGDFNGDGFLDLCARTAPDRLAIYLARSAGHGAFDKGPIDTVGLPPEADFSVADLNGDGLADLLLAWDDAGTDSPVTIAYFTKRGQR